MQLSREKSRSSKVAKEDYLMVIKILSDFYGEANLSLIANELSVTPATAHKVIEHLESEGYVVRLGRGMYALTSNGDSVASNMLTKHRIIEVFLNVLGFNVMDSHMYAHELEHVSDVVIDKIYNMLGRPLICPHGNPIVGKPEGTPLSKSYPGKVVIRSVAELKLVLEFMLRNELKINDYINVLKRRKGRVVIEVNGRQLTVEETVAPGIFVAAQ